MKRIIPYQYILLLLALFALGGCTGCKMGKQKKLNRFVSLWRKDKIPYGTFYAFENLHHAFPTAEISINTSSPAKYAEFAPSDYSNYNKTKKKKAYIIISPRVVPDASEINAMMNFVGEGNSIFISTFYFGDSLLSYLKVKSEIRNALYVASDSLSVKLYSPTTYDTLAFEYPGDSYSSYFSGIDTQYTTVLGTDKFGHPDFLRFTYKSGGAVYLHFAPLVFSNFFLLHKNNKAYYDNAFSYLPQSVNEVKWDDYFRYSREFSAFSFLLNNPPLKWAFWLLLLLFLIIYVFESKRKQRMIPAIAALRNTSLDFVKTIGRLYYQRRDNLNLANKMSIHFLAHVRSKYNLPTSNLDKDFAEKLSYKSGYDKELAKDIVDHIKVMQQQQALSEEGLLLFNHKIEEFYKHT